jgi:protein-tyrosine phosphatase
MTASRVIDRLYIGDWQEARDASSPNLVKVTVAKDSPFMGDYYFPLVDADDPNNEKPLRDAIQKVDELMRQNKTVLVHCVSGVSRSCAVVMGYLIVNGITFDESLSFAKQARPIVNPEPDLLELLRTLKQE